MPPDFNRGLMDCQAIQNFIHSSSPPILTPFNQCYNHLREWNIVRKVKMPDVSRVTRSHPQARDSYDRLSRWYDFIEGGWETGPRRLGLDFLLVKPAEKMLEIGSGTGSSLLELSDRMDTVGLDLSFRMLQQARSRLEKRGRPSMLAQGCLLYTSPSPRD